MTEVKQTCCERTDCRWFDPKKTTPDNTRFQVRSIAPDVTSGESDCGKRHAHRNYASRRGSRASKDYVVRAGCWWWKTRCRGHRQKHEGSPENRGPTQIRCERACRTFCTSIC